MTTPYIENPTNKKCPLKRKDLVDYFPVASKYYPGYVKMSVFRERLNTLFLLAWTVCDENKNVSAMSETEKRDEMLRRTIMPNLYGGNDFRSLVLNGVHATDWRPKNTMDDLVRQLKAQSKSYAVAAVKDPAIQIVGGKVAKMGVGAVSKQVGKIAPKTAKGKMAKSATQWLMEDHSYHEVKIGTFQKGSFKMKFDFNMVDMNVAETAVGKVAEKTGIIPPSEGVDMSLNNDTTRGWLTKYGLSEKWAGYVMGGVDVLSDFIPVAVATKMVESFLANSYLSFRYWNDARKAEETKKFFDKKWDELTSNLKTYICQDIIKLNDKELTALRDYLKL